MIGGILILSNRRYVTVAHDIYEIKTIIGQSISSISTFGYIYYLQGYVIIVNSFPYHIIPYFFNFSKKGEKIVIVNILLDYFVFLSSNSENFKRKNVEVYLYLFTI